MKTHIVKLCVGAEDVNDLADWQCRVMAARRAAGLSAVPTHETRMKPKRVEDVLNGGSMYWVIKGVIRVRQLITGINTQEDSNGRAYCELVFDPVLHETEPTPKRPFQGWRYLKPTEAPADLSLTRKRGDIPAPLKEELLEAGVW